MSQVPVEKTNESEPLMTCRKHKLVTSKSETALGRRDQPRGRLAYCSGGVWHRDGVSSAEALLRNVGTCTLMPRENSK